MARITLRKTAILIAAILGSFTVLYNLSYSMGLIRQTCIDSMDNGFTTALLNPLRSALICPESTGSHKAQPSSDGLFQGKTKFSNKSKTETTPFLSKTPKLSSKEVHPLSCNGCFQTNVTVLIDQPMLCQKPEKKNELFMVLLIISTHSHKKQRHAIRKTWASVTLNNTSSMRHAFILAMPRSGELPSDVMEEAREHEDMVVFEFLDAYDNLTLKTVGSLFWLTSRCPQARYFMKVDDDVWVNPHSLERDVNTNAGFLQQGVMGLCRFSVKPVRNPHNKWYVSKNTFHGSFYPPYCLGFAYISSAAVAKAVVKVSPKVPFFKIEDVYVGMCLQRLGFRVKNLNTFIADWKCEDVPCSKLSAYHSVLPRLMQTMWLRITTTR